MKTSHMHVVSDADIIIHLSNLNKLSLLKALYTEVAIPEYIKSEISGKHDESIQGAINSIFKVFHVSKDKADKIVKQHDIHVGEANVKSLGEELNASCTLQKIWEMRDLEIEID